MGNLLRWSCLARKGNGARSYARVAVCGLASITTKSSSRPHCSSDERIQTRAGRVLFGFCVCEGNPHSPHVQIVWTVVYVQQECTWTTQPTASDCVDGGICTAGVHMDNSPHVQIVWTVVYVQQECTWT